ncbi:hypothetical protein PWY87_10450 [Kribbella solani]|uniref:hypothetical protein n=1 Tax=Kribbella solani TaxID=236067 RepID=UPI0029ADA245|nr:hypothetical protein [Kribbella solani]MDX2973673.1 hypothetical protein [Kribbella solani]MDX3002091.1 hypothetical protein [Kribbella solani]
MSSRRFRLIRHQDVSGVSGTGPVAEGVQFSDGAVALRWYGDYPTTTVWDGIESVVAIHGHGGATVIEWMDPEAGPDPDLELPPPESLPPKPWPDLHSSEPPDSDHLGGSAAPDRNDSPGRHARSEAQDHQNSSEPPGHQHGPAPDSTLPTNQSSARLSTSNYGIAPQDPDPLHSDGEAGAYGAAPPSGWSSYRVFR